ncbi:MAG: glycosyltransferase [Rhodocyclaceae bacterium]|nr:glycosyltransferase [Rhodocyclaceae bacterium]MBX3669577.1 glycosyltransferase [Rhodocyclaceae bacterium]
MHLVQVNLQAGFGGGEIYTCFFGRALRALGQPFDLVVHADAHWWREHDTAAARTHPIRHPEEMAHLPLKSPSWLIYHTPDRGERLQRLRAAGHRLASFVHMPLYQRDGSHFAAYDRLFGVSGYVVAGLLEQGFDQAWPEPMYGIADLDRRASAICPVMAHSRYEFDTRKVRDRVLSWVHPLWQALRPARLFERRLGLTLGVVSRITPIKQFPALFAALAPVLVRYPQVNLEIFGSGGYASVRDTRRALAPLGERVRWWGQQRDVRRIYPLFDFLLTGLPEKEALGLNVLESQLCGTPVLAPAAPPFTETVAHGESGYLYADPRRDAGADFGALLSRLLDGSAARPDPRNARTHLARFGEAAFTERVGRLLAGLAKESE